MSSRVGVHGSPQIPDTPKASSRTRCKLEFSTSAITSSPNLRSRPPGSLPFHPHDTSLFFLGLPAGEQYSLIKQEYLSGLSWQREKALIPAEIYDKIPRILREKASTDTQFRFCVRKTFQLHRSSASSLGLTSTEEMQNSWIVFHKGKRTAHKDEMLLILCDAHQKFEHSGRDATVKEINRTWSYVPEEIVTRFIKVCPTCIGRTIRERNFGLSKAIACESDENYETECSDSAFLLEHHQRSPDTPRASSKFPENVSRAQPIEGLPLLTDKNATLFFSTPRLLISPTSELPKSLTFEESSSQRDNHCYSSASQALTPFSVPPSQNSNSSGITTPSETELDVPLGSSPLEHLTDFKVQLEGSHIVRASSSVVVKRSSADELGCIMNDWGLLEPRKPMVRARSIEVFGSAKKDDTPFHPALAVSPAFQPSDQPIPNAHVSFDRDDKEVLESMSKRPRPINVQTANAPFLVHSQLIPEHQMSSTLSPWRCSYSRVLKGSQGRDPPQQATDSDISEGRTTTSYNYLSRSCTDTISNEVESLPPTPSSAASVWSQDSAPNSAIFWNVNAQEYASEYP